MMESAPSTSFKMPKPDLLLEVLIVALDTPAQLGQIDQMVEGNLFRQCREPVFGRLVLAFGPLDEQPFFRAALAEIVIAMGSPHAKPCKAREQRLGRAFAPLDGTPGSCGQVQREFLDRDRPMIAVAAHQPGRPSLARPILWTQRLRTWRPHRGVRQNARYVSQP